MASPTRHFDAAADEERLLDVVRALVSELGHQTALASVGPAAHLERELGLGSLERVDRTCPLPPLAERLTGRHQVVGFVGVRRRDECHRGRRE